MDDEKTLTRLTNMASTSDRIPSHIAYSTTESRKHDTKVFDLNSDDDVDSLPPSKKLRLMESKVFDQYGGGPEIAGPNVAGTTVRIGHLLATQPDKRERAVKTPPTSVHRQLSRSDQLKRPISSDVRQLIEVLEPLPVPSSSLRSGSINDNAQECNKTKIANVAGIQSSTRTATLPTPVSITTLPSLTIDYKEIKPSTVPTSFHRVRSWYLKFANEHLPPPFIVHSSIVPLDMVVHLMRAKKDRAMGVKFENKPSKDQEKDMITNMEGALHTVVIPAVEITMVGDHTYKPFVKSGHHDAARFGSSHCGGFMLGRKVLLSALVQPDFRNHEVMAVVAALDSQEISGSCELPTQISVDDKQNPVLRLKYDNAIKKYLSYHLSRSGRLPSTSDVQPKTITDTILLLEDIVLSVGADDLPSALENVYLQHTGEVNGVAQFQKTVLSLDVMFRTALEQIRGEFFLLERLCREQKYNYVWDPPVIFTWFFGNHDRNGTHLLSRVHCAALKYFASTTKLQGMRLFAWNNFEDSKILQLVQTALESQPHIIVLSKATLFSKEPRSIRPKPKTVSKNPSVGKVKKLSQRKGTKQSKKAVKRRAKDELSAPGGLYTPPRGTESAILVLHNNSDGFGQNVETERGRGSLDGVIGCNSSAAASLRRTRDDLCSLVVELPH